MLSASLFSCLKFKIKEKIMRVKRFTAILLLIVTVIGLFPAVSMAAETPDEALGEIHIYNGGEQLAYC